MDLDNTEPIVDSEIQADDSDSEEIPLTVEQVLEIMEEAWQNEKFAPEILPHKSEIVDCLLGQIAYMEKNLQNVSNADFQKSLHQMELDRVRFMISSYLRTRLEKVETYVYAIIKQEDQRNQQNEPMYLTETEYEFAKAYKEGLDQLFEEVLRFWPDSVPEDWKDKPILPNMHSFVFAKSKTEIEGVLLDDGNDDDEAMVDLHAGSQMVISYQSIARLVKDDQVGLI